MCELISAYLSWKLRELNASPILKLAWSSQTSIITLISHNFNYKSWKPFHSVDKLYYLWSACISAYSFNRSIKSSWPSIANNVHRAQQSTIVLMLDTHFNNRKQLLLNIDSVLHSALHLTPHAIRRFTEYIECLPVSIVSRLRRITLILFDKLPSIWIECAIQLLASNFWM